MDLNQGPTSYEPAALTAELYPRAGKSEDSVLIGKYLSICCDENGPPPRHDEGAISMHIVTEEQRRHRVIFIATLWAVGSFAFLYGALLQQGRAVPSGILSSKGYSAPINSLAPARLAFSGYLYGSLSRDSKHSIPRGLVLCYSQWV